MVGDGVPALVRPRFRARGRRRCEAAGLPRYIQIMKPSANRPTRPYPGVRETLASARRPGYPPASVTNKLQQARWQVL